MKVKSLVLVLSLINMQTGASFPGSTNDCEEQRLSSGTARSDGTCGSPVCQKPREGSNESTRSNSRARSYSMQGRRTTAMENFDSMFAVRTGKKSAKKIFQTTIAAYFENIRAKAASKTFRLTFSGIDLSEDLFRGTTPEVIDRLYAKMIDYIKVGIVHNDTKYSCSLTTFLNCGSTEKLTLKNYEDDAITKKNLHFKKSKKEYTAPSDEEKISVSVIIKKAILNIFAAHDTAFHDNDKSRNFGVHLSDNPGNYYVKLGEEKAEVVKRDARAQRAATPAIGHIYNDDGEEAGRGSGVLLAGRRSAVPEETREALKNAKDNSRKADSRKKHHASSRPNVEIAAKRLEAKKNKEKANQDAAKPKTKKMKGKTKKVATGK